MRNADASELDQLAKLWHDGWQEAHAPILPPELARFRTLPSFRSRLEAALADVRVMGPVGGAVGFSLIKGDELNQLYVSAAARGSGVAVALLVDAEQLLAARGVDTAWLACAIGNQRAARFYEKNAWRRVGIESIQVPAAEGTLPLDVWRYEKKLASLNTAGPPNAPAIFITIPLSHYCEKARWGLDRAGLPYEERAHAPLFSRLAGGTVPALIHGSRRLLESTDILIYADEIRGGDVLYPRDARLRAEVESLIARFDAELGLHARRWAYSHLLADAKLLRAVWSQRVPRVEALLVPVISPLARWLARRSYKISPESAQRSLDRVRGVFQEVEARLGDGRRFLSGDRFSAADLTFAALAAPMVFPVECRAVQPALEEVPARMREVILQLRETDAGRFVMRMFAQERQPGCAVPVL